MSETAKTLVSLPFLGLAVFMLISVNQDKSRLPDIFPAMERSIAAAVLAPSAPGEEAPAGDAIPMQSVQTKK